MLSCVKGGCLLLSHLNRNLRRLDTTKIKIGTPGVVEKNAKDSSVSHFQEKSSGLQGAE
jgi:hypothetical protein